MKLAATPKARLEQYRAKAEECNKRNTALNTQADPHTWRDHVKKGRHIGASSGPLFNENGATVRFFFKPEAFGFRYIGEAHDVCKRLGSRLVEHDGWYSDSFQDNTITGVLYQLPGKQGCAQYVYGYKASDSDGVVLCLSDIKNGSRYGSGHINNYGDDDAQLDAVVNADNHAKRTAESEREYNDAWQAGNFYRNASEDLKEMRKKVRAAIREIKAKPDIPPTLCSMLRDAVNNLLEELNDTRKTMVSLRDMHSMFSNGEKRLREAFNDGAGREVLKVAQ